MSELKIKLELNGGEELLDLSGREDLARRLFDYLLTHTTAFELNDDGSSYEYKEQLQPLLLGESQDNPGMYRFSIDDETSEILQELFAKLENAPNVKWALRGDGLSLEYSENQNDETEQGVVEIIRIMAGGKVLDKVNELLETKINT